MKMPLKIITTWFNCDKVKLYSEMKECPSIDPVVPIKIVMIQALFGLNSMRQAIRDIQLNKSLNFSKVKPFLNLNYHIPTCLLV